jgi:long-subunit fatty acid transport protein
VGKALLFVVFLALLAKAGLTALFSSDKGDVHGPAVLLEEPGVRALGLGGAYVAVADGADAVYWNPAGLQLMKRKEVQLMHAELFADQNQDAIAYVHPGGGRENGKPGGAA